MTPRMLEEQPQFSPLDIIVGWLQESGFELGSRIPNKPVFKNGPWHSIRVLTNIRTGYVSICWSFMTPDRITLSGTNHSWSILDPNLLPKLAEQLAIHGARMQVSQGKVDATPS